MWQTLPLQHRLSWSVVAVEQHLASTTADFADYTDNLQQYNRKINSGTIRDFITAMDDYAFPCVKCPAGCFAYLHECTTVGFHHYIAWKFDIKLFNADASYFRGARRDWPMTSIQLQQFTVAPGSVMDANVGLAVLVCKQHDKGGLFRQACLFNTYIT